MICNCDVCAASYTFTFTMRRTPTAASVIDEMIVSVTVLLWVDQCSRTLARYIMSTVYICAIVHIYQSTPEEPEEDLRQVGLLQLKDGRTMLSLQSKRKKARRDRDCVYVNGKKYLKVQFWSACTLIKCFHLMLLYTSPTFQIEIFYFTLCIWQLYWVRCMLTISTNKYETQWLC